MPPDVGAVNQPQPTGDIYLLKINEWLASGSPTMPDDLWSFTIRISRRWQWADCISATRPTLASTSPDRRSQLHRGRRILAFKADGNTGAGPEHLNFHLAAEAGAIGLFAPDLSLIDLVLYGPQSTGVSQGRSPNGAATLAFSPRRLPFRQPDKLRRHHHQPHHDLHLDSVDHSGDTTPAARPRHGMEATNFVDSRGPAPGIARHRTFRAVSLRGSHPHAARVDQRRGTPVITYYFRTSFNVTTNLAGSH